MHHLITTPKTHLISLGSMTHYDEIDYHLKWTVKTSRTIRSLVTYKRFKNDGDKTGRSWNNKLLWTGFRTLDGLIMGGLKLDGLKLDGLKLAFSNWTVSNWTVWVDGIFRKQSKPGRSQIGRSQIRWSHYEMTKSGRSFTIESFKIKFHEICTKFNLFMNRIITASRK